MRAFRAVEVVLPGTLVDSTVRAAVPFAAGKALAVGVISSRVAILIEEVLKTMVITKLKLASVVVLLIGAAGAAAVLAQPGPRSDASQAADQPQGPQRPSRGGPLGVDSAQHQHRRTSRSPRDDPHAPGGGSRRGPGAARSHHSEVPVAG